MTFYPSYRSIFYNKARLLELYNAIEGTNYQDESIIEINTLNDVLFIVLYNGKEPFPKEKFLRLSDAFKKSDNDGLIYLDLIVRILNINKGNVSGFKLRRNKKEIRENVAREARLIKLINHDTS